MPRIDSFKPTGLHVGKDTASARGILPWILLPTVVLAFLLRLSSLDKAVLTPVEACNAWPAWAAVHGIDWRPLYSNQHTTSPLLTNALWFSFQCVEASDALARAVPALFGALLVMLPWFFRRWLGTWGTLTAMILLSLDSWQLAFSRLADGAILSMFFAVASLACMECAKEAAEGRRPLGLSERAVLLILAVILALFTASSAESWSLAPPIAACFLLMGGRTKTSEGCIVNPRPQSYVRDLIAPYAVTLIVALSLFGARWENIQALGAGLTQWLHNWGPTRAPEFGFGWMMERISRDQPLTLIAGVAGLVMMWHGSGESEAGHARRRTLVFSMWILWGMTLAVAGGRGPAGLLVMALPLKMAAALALGRLIQEITAASQRGALLMRVLLAVGLLVAILLWTQRYYRNTSTHHPTVRLAVLIAASTVLLCLLFRQVRFRLEAIAVLIVVLFAAELNGTWNLNRRIHTEPVFFGSIGHPDLRILASDVRQWVLAYREAERDVSVRVADDIPGDCLPAWYLRDFFKAGDDSDRGGSAHRPIWITQDKNALAPVYEPFSPVPYRIDIRRPAVSGPGTAVSAQDRSDVVFLWLPRQ